MSRFECDADVRDYLIFQADLGPTPSPPADLWEQMDTARRAAGRTHGAKLHSLGQPDLAALVFPEIKVERRTHPVRVVEQLAPVPDVRPWRAKIYKLKRSP